MTNREKCIKETAQALHTFKMPLHEWHYPGHHNVAMAEHLWKEGVRTAEGFTTINPAGHRIMPTIVPREEEE